jgi:hypothetical protein
LIGKIQDRRLEDPARKHFLRNIPVKRTFPEAEILFQLCKKRRIEKRLAVFGGGRKRARKYKARKERLLPGKWNVRKMLLNSYDLRVVHELILARDR